MYYPCFNIPTHIYTQVLKRREEVYLKRLKKGHPNLSFNIYPLPI